jgi:phosphopantetheinyl transferase (holo-ACP synthase)
VKEATYKALQPSRLLFPDIETQRSESGSPVLVLHNAAAAVAASRGVQVC